MRSEWKEVRLKDIVDFNPTESLRKGTIAKKISMADIVEHRRSIPTYEQAEYTGGTRFCNRDTLFARITPSLENGKIAQVDVLDCDEVGFGSTEFIVWRGKKDMVDPDFVFYLANYPPIVDAAIKSMVGSSGRQRVQLDVLENFRYCCPPLSTQEGIANTLSCLDAKIELNNKINENLEAQAQAIFKSWFVDFEPFGGVRPSDWEVRRLGEYFPVITGKMNANVASDTGSYPFFSCSQSVGLTDQYSFDAKAVLVAGNGGFNVKWYDGKFEAYQRTYVLIPHDGRLLGFLYYATRTGLADITSGARGSVIRFITKGSIENHEITVPINLAELPVVQTLQRMNEQIARRDKESKALAALRDTLLPKLMSGEIEVPID